MHRIAGLAAAALLYAPAAAQAPAQPPVLAAWSQISGVADAGAAGGLVAPAVEMRFLLGPGGDCSAFGVEHRLAPDAAWQPAGPAMARGGRGPAGALAVTVCSLAMASGGRDWFDARLRWGAADAVLSSRLVGGDTAATVGQSFAPGPADGRAVRLWGGASIGTRGAGDGPPRLVVAALGDTGCRGVPAAAQKPQATAADQARLARMTQACDAASWPLTTLAAAAAAAGPDLVIHVGDYRYFLEDELPRPPDPWLFWQKDFFPAAQELLLAAPLVPVRGNHEACGAWGFGDEYLQLFGTGAATRCSGAPGPASALRLRRRPRRARGGRSRRAPVRGARHQPGRGRGSGRRLPGGDGADPGSGRAGERLVGDARAGDNPGRLRRERRADRAHR